MVPSLAPNNTVSVTDGWLASAFIAFSGEETTRPFMLGAAD